MIEDEYGSNVRHRVDHIERHYFVGRDREIQLFTELLSKRLGKEQIINIYGTGGVGKSYLLDEFRRICVNNNVKFLLLDGRDLPKNPVEFCLYLLRILRHQITNEERIWTDSVELTEMCLRAIHATAEQEKVIIAFDTFEEMGEIENWLRDHLLIHIKSDIFIIIAGRFPLQGRWYASPGWRELIYRLPIIELDYQEVVLCLKRFNITGEDLVHSIWLKSQGHPLTVALLAAIATERSLQSISTADQRDVFEQIVDVWMLEVLDNDMREMIWAAAVLRQFNQELLSYVLEKQVSVEQFMKLCRYSFVRRVGHGWQIHDLMREATQQELRLRAPDYFDRLWKRCILYYYHRIVQSPNKRLSSWESGEWVYYTAGLMVRTVFYQQEGTYNLEPLHTTNWHEAEAYIKNRYTNAKPSQLIYTNPEMGEWNEFHFTVEDSLNGLKHFDLERLYNLDPNIVMLARDFQGKVCGLSAFIPINGHTLGYLQTHPLSSAYFSDLSESRLKELRTLNSSNAGFFVSSIDAHDISDVPLLQALLSRFFTPILTTGYVVAAPPVHPFWHSILHSVGAEMVKDIVHFAYDGKTPTPLFVVDIRGRKLIDYLGRIMASRGIHEVTEFKDDRIQDLTRREKEVVGCLVKGLTNLEIAEELCLSEATVKKHVTNAFKKLAVKNRTQLVNIYRDID